MEAEKMKILKICNVSRSLSKLTPNTSNNLQIQELPDEKELQTALTKKGTRALQVGRGNTKRKVNVRPWQWEKFLMTSLRIQSCNFGSYGAEKNKKYLISILFSMYQFLNFASNAC